MCNTLDVNSKLFNCQKIIRVFRIKQLGLIIDWNLPWKIHIENLIVRPRSVIFKLFKINKILPTETMYVVYNALYKTILQYGLLLWSGCAVNALNKLEVQQNLTLRIC